MLYRSISSTCHANVALHVPKYKYGVLTPGSCVPTPASLRISVRYDGKSATFQLLVLSLKSEPEVD